MSSRLEAHLRAEPGLLPDGAKVLVAVSGGPDSTALLHLLLGLAAGRRWTVEAAHFDHGMRAESAEEARSLANRLQAAGITLHSGVAPARLRPNHEAMRRARYEWLRLAAAGTSADRIATGHHHDDQAETVLFRMLRGTGNRGLAGIPARRGRIVRPLLPFPASEIRAWAREAGLVWLDDPANRDPRWARSRIRRDLIPALAADIGPDITDRLVAVGRAAADAEKAAGRFADAVLLSAAQGGRDTFARAHLLAWPQALRSEIVRRVAREHGVTPTRRATLQAARGMRALRSGQGFDLGGRLRLERTYDRFLLRRVSDQDADGRVSIPRPSEGRATLTLRSRRYRVHWGTAAAGSDSRSRVALSIGREHYPLTVRSWAPGDRIRTQGGSRRVKRLFQEARVPRHARRSCPVLVDRRQDVLWIPGLRGGIGAFGASGSTLTIEIEDA